MRARRSLIGIAACAAAFMLSTGLALAHDHGVGWVHVDEDEVEVGAEGGGIADGAPDAGASAGTGGASGPVCEWELVPQDHIVNRRWADDDDVTLYFRTCPDEPRTIVPVRDGDPVGPEAPMNAWERALELLVLPSPQIEVNPSEPIVHVETWLWIDPSDWAERSESASAAGVTATVTATPRRVVWDTGNGDHVVCDGPGTAYDTSRPADAQATDCSYTYRHTSAGRPGDAYEVSATIEWSLSWSIEGAPGGAEVTTTTTSSTVLVGVGEMQAVNR